MEDFDLENPLTSSKSQEQDQTDMISELFASESDHMPAESHFQSLKSQHSLVSLRRDATSSIVKARFSCNIDPFVAYLAMNYLNRFVSRRGMLSAKPWILKLLSVSCFSLAAKMMKTSLSLTDFQMEEGIIFDSQTIQRMELLILGALNWRMRSITPFAFLHFFLCVFERNDPPLKQSLKARATDLIFKAQNEIKILKYKPSIVTASALLSASHELSPMQFPCFLKAISSCPYINKEELLDCCNLMQDVVMDGYGSIVFDRASSSDKAVSALDCDFLTSESENTNNMSSRSDIIRSEAEIKRPKLSDFCCNETFHQLSQQMQRC
ncbi:hypothetical protein AAC387_Pa04g1546 [Persea americana]